MLTWHVNQRCDPECPYPVTVGVPSPEDQSRCERAHEAGGLTESVGHAQDHRGVPGEKGFLFFSFSPLNWARKVSNNQNPAFTETFSPVKLSLFGFPISRIRMIFLFLFHIQPNTRRLLNLAPRRKVKEADEVAEPGEGGESD